MSPEKESRKPVYAIGFARDIDRYRREHECVHIGWHAARGLAITADDCVLVGNWWALPNIEEIENTLLPLGFNLDDIKARG